MAYPTTDQVAAVLSFINGAAHRGRVKLITVSIGGNDVTACATKADPVGCVVTAASTIKTNITSLVSQLDTALTANGDTGADIVGITYPDVILGDCVAPVGGTNQALASLSKVAFDAVINPTLATAYTSANTPTSTRGGFVDVTSAPYGLATAGDDTGSFDATTYAYTGPTEKVKGFGTAVPAPVAEVCTITWYCDPATFGDIHATTKGYDFIGRLIVATVATL